MNEESPKVTTSSEKETKILKFHFVKSTAFRVIHVDGVVGSPSPDGDGLHMAIFSERMAIPIEATLEIQDGGRVGKEIDRVAREGIVREVEADLFMSVDTARNLLEWLKNQIPRAEQAAQDVAKVRADKGEK